MSTPTNTPETGRRAARRDRRALDRLAVGGAVLVALATALLVTGGVVEAGPEQRDGATAVPVDQVSTACAAFPAPGRGQVLTLAAPLPDAPAGGTLTAGPVGGPAEDVADGAGRGVLVRLRPTAASATDAAFAVRADDGEAAGRTTYEVDRQRGTAAVAVQECLAPRGRWWFTGAGAGLDHTSTLVVTNLDPGQAVIDVEVHGPDGRVDAVGTRGITVPSGEVHTVDLLDVAPQAEELSVRVEASRGRVVAALADRFATRPASAPGREWIPAQADPSRVLRLAPLPVRADRRTLVVGNPTDREALAEIEISTGSGTFPPTEVSQVRVPPGAVVTADLGSAVGREAAAVLLRSPVPLTATVRSTRGADVSYAAAAPLLGGPAAVVVPQGLAPSLQLTAADDGGTARVVAYTADGEEVDAADLELEPATTTTWAPKRPADYLVVTPRSGRISGGLALTGGAGVAQAALRELPVMLRRPVVVPVVR